MIDAGLENLRGLMTKNITMIDSKMRNVGVQPPSLPRARNLLSLSRHKGSFPVFSLSSQTGQDYPEHGTFSVSVNCVHPWPDPPTPLLHTGDHREAVRGDRARETPNKKSEIRNT